MRWINVNDKLPEYPIDKRGYLCRACINRNLDHPIYMVLDYEFYDECPHFEHEDKEGNFKVTHWLPLPEPIEEVQKKIGKENENGKKNI